MEVGAAGGEGRQWRQTAYLGTKKHHLGQSLSFRCQSDLEGRPGHSMLMTTKEEVSEAIKPSGMGSTYTQRITSKGRCCNGNFQSCSCKVDFQSQIVKGEKDNSKSTI